MTTEALFTPSRSGEIRQGATERTFKRLSSLLDADISGPMDLIALGRAGLDPSAVDKLASHGLVRQKLEWIINPRTLRTCKLQGQRLTPAETDRLIRAMRILALANEVFGSEAKAIRWLQKPLSRFEGKSAIDLLSSELGADLVEEVLVRIDEGFAA